MLFSLMGLLWVFFFFSPRLELVQESQCGWAQRKLGVPVCPQEQFFLQAAKD